MKIEYFTDTDTLLIEFSSCEISETRDLNETTLVEFDDQGTLVSMTIEHAKEQADLEEFIFHPRQTVQNTPCMVAEETTEYKTK
jgi:uncharacterized protein YuzE